MGPGGGGGGGKKGESGGKKPPEDKVEIEDHQVKMRKTILVQKPPLN